MVLRLPAAFGRILLYIEIPSEKFEHHNIVEKRFWLQGTMGMDMSYALRIMINDTVRDGHNCPWYKMKQ
jgi:hypothetical protein